MTGIAYLEISTRTAGYKETCGGDEREITRPEAGRLARRCEFGDMDCGQPALCLFYFFCFSIFGRWQLCHSGPDQGGRLGGAGMAGNPAHGLGRACRFGNLHAPHVVTAREVAR